LGSDFGPHDGTSLFEQSVFGVTNQSNLGDGKIIVTSAGNRGYDTSDPNRVATDRIHAYGTNPTYADFEVNSGDGGGRQNEFFWMQIWYPQLTDYSIKITAPNGRVYGPFAQNEGTGDPGGGWYYQIDTDGYVEIHNEHFNSDSNHDKYYHGTSDNYIDIFIGDLDIDEDGTSDYDLRAGTWKITMTEGAGRWDAYIPYTEGVSDGVYFSESTYENARIISEPGNAYNVITVGSYNSKNSWKDYYNNTQTMTGFPIDQVSYFSSSGPTRDGRDKPELYAPGAWIASALSNDATKSNTYKANDHVHYNASGTSMSSPHVTGAVALLLEQNNTYNYSDILSILNQSKTPQGYLDVYSALDVNGTPTGIEDGISIESGPNFFSPGDNVTYTAQFIDIGDPSVLINWDWKIELIHSEGSYIYATGYIPLSWNYSTWQISTSSSLPTNYDWLRDEDGNIFGKVIVSGTDSDNIYHETEKNIGVEFGPSKPIIYNHYPGGGSINLSYLSSGATSYKIFYDINSAHPYLGTGATEGNSPINVENLNSFELTNLSIGVPYFVAVKGYNSDGESVYSEEVTIKPITTNGSLGTDETWYGIINITNDVTVPSGVTLTIREGTTLIFESDSRLKIYGTLNVNGTVINKVTIDFVTIDYPNGVWFLEGSSGTIENAIIKNANYGLYIYKSAPTIKNCEIYDCSNGIRSYYNSPNIETNKLHDINNFGMYFYKGSPTITDNYLYDIDGYGIAVNSVYTETYIRENTIDNCSGGVYALGSNTVKLRGGNGASYGKNIIQNYGSSRHAVYITGGTPDLGEAHPSSHKGYNNFYRVGGTYVVKNTTGNEVMAERNYWGTSPLSTWFYGNIDWGEELSSPYSSAGSSLDKTTGIEPDKQILYDANDLVDSKTYLSGSDKYKQLISDYPDSRYGGTALAWSMATYQLTKDLETQRDYLQKHTTHKNERVRNSATLWLQTLEAEVGNKKAVEKIVNSTSINEVVGVEIRLNWANDLLNMYNDEKGAEAIFDELTKTSASESTLFTIAAIKSTALNFEGKEESPKSENNNSVVETVVSETKLNASYPNPFNPTAAISYQLQYKSHVSLIVYNSIGQVVVELVNQQKEKGIYNVDFDASDLSSGLYIYRLQVNTPDGKGNYTQAKKMLLLK